MEDRSLQFFKRALPEQWVIREYRPDYGIDLAIEVFAEVNGKPTTYEAMGEHFFVQLKSIKTLSSSRMVARPRRNVLRFPLESQADKDDPDVQELDVLSYRIETKLLNTVQAMGSSTVVLLVVVALDVERLFFVCLNDYIDKVLIPESPGYREQKTISLKIPIKNEIDAKRKNLREIEFLAQRAKHYSAFNLIRYQSHELKCAENENDYLQFAIHSMNLLRHLDIWNHPVWPVFRLYKAWMDHLEKGIAALPDLPDTWFLTHPYLRLKDLESVRLLGCKSWIELDIRSLWDGMSGMGRMYEELCRERCLPTYFSEVIW
jgi:hypothetical protein